MFVAWGVSVHWCVQGQRGFGGDLCDPQQDFPRELLGGLG